MAYVVRRVFFAKPGQAGPLVDHFKAGEEQMASGGFNIESRTLTDFQTGRSDRVVVEWTVESLDQFGAAMGEFMSNAEAARGFQQWERDMNSMIDYSEGEMWEIR